MEQVDASRCPICGQPNRCRIAKGGPAACSACWCFDLAIAPARLDAVPEPARGRACICPSCAGTAAEQHGTRQPTRDGE